MNEKTKFQFISPYHDNLGLSVYNCGFQRCDSLYSWGPALRNHQIIHFVANGRGRFVFRGKEYSVETGMGFYCPADEVVFYQADERDPWEYYWVGFEGVDASRLLNACGISEDHPCFTTNNVDEIKRCLLAIYQSNGIELANQTEMIGSLYHFFSALIREQSNEKKPTKHQAQYLDVVARYIERNYALPISVTDMAKSAALSRSQLYRIFVQELGITPNEYLTQFRIANACDLLRSRDITVSEAAYSSGFSDPLYFSRVFKKIKGVSPSAYAKNVK